MTVDFAHTYTEPPRRVGAGLSGGGAAHDPVQPREFCTDPDVANMLPAGSRVHLFDTGHFWPFEAPLETVDVIRAFLDSVTG